MDFLLFLVFAGAAGALGIWLGMRLSRRVGAGADARPAIRTRTLVMLILMTLPALVAAWLIATGHAAIGIGILIAVFVIPNLIEIPIRIRQSNRRAREARARREGRRA
jgi:hypothetical protein